MGVWSTSRTRETHSQPLIDLVPKSPPSPLGEGRGEGFFPFRTSATRRERFSCTTSRASVDFPEPDTPVTTDKRPSGNRTLMSFKLCSFAPTTSTDGVDL